MSERGPIPWNLRGLHGGALLALAVTALLVITSPGAQFARGASTGLVAAFAFDEGTGSTAADSGGAGLVATLTNTTWSTGHSGRALAFDGSDSWATVADDPSLDLTSGMTLEAWVDPSSSSKGWRTAIAKERSGDLIYGLYTSSSNGPAGLVYTGGNKWVFGSSNLSSGRWRHVAATFDGTTERLYVNGSLVASAPAAGSMPSSGNPLRIGGNAVRGQWFRGLIDDVRIYSRALSGSEIRTDLNTPVPAPAPARTSAPVPADSQAPSVPDGLAVSATSASSVSISWTASNDNVGVAGYGVYLNGAVAGGTTSTSYSLTGLACGTSYTLAVDAYDAASNRSAQTSLVSATAPCSSSSSSPPPPPPAPTNTSLPTVSGSALVGATLTASAGSWSGSPTKYAYQWQYCSADMASCSDITGNTATSYSPVTWDAGGRDRVKVTATNAGGSTVAYSQPTAVIAKPIAAPANTSLPTIGGTTTVGSALTATTGSWSGSPTGYGYQWRRCDAGGNNCANIGDATAAGYTLAGTDQGSTLRVVVTATNAGGSSSATSAQTAGVAGTPPTTSAVTTAATTTTPTPSPTPAPAQQTQQPYWTETFDKGASSLDQPWWRYEPSYDPNLDRTVPGLRGNGIGLHTTAASYGPNSNSQASNIWCNEPCVHGSAGSTTWYRFHFLLPSGLYQPTPGEWNWIWEWHDDDTTQDLGANSMAMGIFNNSGSQPTLTFRAAGGNAGAPTYTVFKLPPGLQYDHWYDVVFGITWGYTNASAHVTWIVDGVTYADAALATLYTRPDGSLGGVEDLGLYQYHLKASYDMEIRYDDVTVGPTRASVGA
jgi:hypothetical protein